jgi:hypothetical protein
MGWYVKYLRIYCHRGGPNENEEWDGFRIAIFDFEDAVPGKILWPTNGEPLWVRPEIGSYCGWYDFRVDWMGPWNVFLAAVEQYYDPPNCDAVSFDAGSWQSEHTWYAVDGAWMRFDQGTNLMLRVQAELQGGVAPSSLGRVKALYR